jgi:hypothetical protein
MSNAKYVNTKFLSDLLTIDRGMALPLKDRGIQVMLLRWCERAHYSGYRQEKQD